MIETLLAIAVVAAWTAFTWLVAKGSRYVVPPRMFIANGKLYVAPSLLKMMRETIPKRSRAPEPFAFTFDSFSIPVIADEALEGR